MKCDCGHTSDGYAIVKKYGFGNALEEGCMCPMCWYFSCFCNVETIKRRNIEVYRKLKKAAERKLNELDKR